MINRVVAREDLEPEVEALAENIARAPLSTLMGTKSLLVRAWDEMGMRQHLQTSADVMSIMEKTSDAVELRRRLAEQGRKPREMARQGNGDD